MQSRLLRGQDKDPNEPWVPGRFNVFDYGGGKTPEEHQKESEEADERASKRFKASLDAEAAERGGDTELEISEDEPGMGPNSGSPQGWI